MDKREAAGVLAQCKWLRDNISVWESAAKQVLAQELSAGERTAATAPDGTQLGYVTMAQGARSMRVNNEAGFIAWVAQRYPTEIERTVRPAFMKLCAEKVKKLGMLPDANGEVCPHVSLDVGDPKATTNLNEFADLMIRAMILRRPLMDVITPPSELPTNAVPDYVEQSSGGATPFEEAALSGTGYPPEDDAARLARIGREGVQIDLNSTAPFKDVPEEASFEPPEDEQVGPPEWGESNTFESSDAIRQHRKL